MASHYDSVILADTPVAFWELNESSGTSASDATGDGYTGAYTGGYTLGATGIGDGETAVTLNGSTGYVDVTAASALRPAQVTAEAWIYPTATVNGAFAMSSNVYATSVGFALGTDPLSANFNLLFGSYNGSWHQVVDTVSLGLNQWYHVVGTYDGTSLRVYKNGSLVGGPLAFAGPLAYDAADLRIGRRWDTSSAYFKGTIAKAAVYNYALTATQVSNHYAAASYTPPPLPLRTLNSQAAMWRSCYR